MRDRERERGKERRKGQGERGGETERKRDKTDKTDRQTDRADLRPESALVPSPHRDKHLNRWDSL